MNNFSTKAILFYWTFLFVFFNFISCVGIKEVNASEEVFVEEPVAQNDTSIVLKQLLTTKDSLIVEQTKLAEEMEVVLEQIKKTSLELDEHDEQFRKKSPEYQAMLPIYVAVSDTRKTPEYKRLSTELGAAQTKMNQNVGNEEYKMLYDKKLKEYKAWEVSSGRAALKKQLMPLRAKFIEYEAKSGRTALGNKIQSIERRRISINTELASINQQLVELETKIKTHQ